MLLEVGKPTTGGPNPSLRDLIDRLTDLAPSHSKLGTFSLAMTVNVLRVRPFFAECTYMFWGSMGGHWHMTLGLMTANVSAFWYLLFMFAVDL